MNGWLGVFVGALLLLLGSLASAAAQPPPSDVGLVTKLAGEVTYWNEAYQRTPANVEAFMKVRKGDHLKVPAGGLVQLVYFQSSQQETWKGPAILVVGDGRGQPEGDTKAQPEVITLPPGAQQGIQRVPVLLRRAGLSRSGAMQVRGIQRPEPRASAAPPALTQEEQAEIAAARETYQGMKKRAVADDVTPEMYFLGVLTDYEQYEEMEQVVKEALKKQPGNELLKDLEKWVSAQKAKGTAK
jgi:hypothetical protein